MTNTKNKPFTMVDYETAMREDLSAYDRSVYLTLCAYSNRVTAECFPSYQTIAKKSGCGKRTAIASIAHLEELGLIDKEIRFKDRRYNSNIYTVCGSPAPAYNAPDAPVPLPDASLTPPDAGDAPGDAHGALKLDVLNQMQMNQTSSLEEISFWKDKIEYDTLAQEMPDMLSVLEFVPGIICELSTEEFASALCADDVRAFMDSREDRASLLPLTMVAPFHLRGCIRRFLMERHDG